MRTCVCGAYTVKDKAVNAVTYERVMDLFPRLQERRRQVAGYLQRRRAADARHRDGR